MRYIGDIITDQDKCIICGHDWSSHDIMGNACVGAMIQHYEDFPRIRYDDTNDCKCPGFDNSTHNCIKRVR